MNNESAMYVITWAISWSYPPPRSSRFDPTSHHLLEKYKTDINLEFTSKMRAIRKTGRDISIISQNIDNASYDEVHFISLIPSLEYEIPRKENFKLK